MTPRAWYESRAHHWTAVREQASQRAVVLSRLRLATFLGGVAAVWWGLASAATAAPIAFAGGVALLAAFASLIVVHARVLERIDRANAALQYGVEGLARIGRDWGVLPEVPPPATLDADAHPYARDLDVFGHASLTKWLGAPATVQGSRCLWDWLLTPADAGDLVERQAAVADLAARGEWRESLAVEGRLTHASALDLERFLTWAESSESDIPRMMLPVAVVLTAANLALLAAYSAGSIDAWFVLPMTIAIVLSFAYARRLYAVFDRAGLGERALGGYAAMLSLGCSPSWSAPMLARLRGELCAGGDAPVRVAKLARLGGWSELRTSAALLHLPIQALTLWDFHVYFAFERWRARSGRHVRAWLAALGAIDALAVLSRSAADEPAWTVPRIEPSAPSLRASALGHPLIAQQRRVANDVEVGPAGTLLLITGSNMSGKSTLLRAIGLNTVLAQAGGAVCAASFLVPPVNLHTSIRVQDSLELGLSYFMAALARLKQIVDAAERGAGPRRIFYLLDEVLQGTNSIERALAVRAVVRHLLDAGAIGVMTTHDLALAGEEPIAGAARLAHFTEQVQPDGGMTFDYRLRPGLATSTNALRLMQLIGITPK